MAKVKIQGHASGTGVLTVTAPNTSTDRTITLPDGTGTLIADDGSGNLGINTTTPSSLLEVKAGSNSTTDYPITVLNSAESVTTGYGAYGIDQSASSAYTIDVHDDLVIKSNTGENLRVLENGGITFNGDTAAANALDDYEEGTWTMALTCGSGSVTQSNAAGNYTKIGRQVTLTGYADVASISSPSGLLTIGGIPFDNASNATGFYTAVAVQGSNWVSSVTDLYGSLSGNNLYIFGFSSGNQTAVADKLQVGSAININVSYFTA